MKWVRLPPASFECNYKQGLTSLGQRRAEAADIARITALAVAFRQAGGDDPLDSSGVHPEAYPVVRRILDRCSTDLKELGRDPAKLEDIKARGVEIRKVDFDDAGSLAAARDPSVAEASRPYR